MCTEPYQALGGRPGLVGWEPHLVKMSAVPEATLSFNVIPIKIMVAGLRNRKKKIHNIHPPPQMTRDSKSVFEKQDRAGCSTFRFQMMSQRHRIKQCGFWAPSWLRWLSIRLLTTPPAPILGVVSSSPGLGHGRGMEPM